jgi:hypothetical protein
MESSLEGSRRPPGPGDGPREESGVPGRETKGEEGREPGREEGREPKIGIWIRDMFRDFVKLGMQHRVVGFEVRTNQIAVI